MEDCLRLIFDLLRPRDMLPFRLVCKDWYVISNDEVVVNKLLGWRRRLPRVILADDEDKIGFRSAAKFMFSHEEVVGEAMFDMGDILCGLLESGKLNYAKISSYESKSWFELEKSPRAVDVLMIYSLETNSFIVREDYIRALPRSRVRSLYSYYYYKSTVSIELLSLLVFLDRTDYLSMLFAHNERGKIPMNDAIREIIELACKHESEEVYYWLCTNVVGNIAQSVYTYAIQNSNEKILRWFRYMKPGLLRIAREMKNDTSVGLIEGM